MKRNREYKLFGWLSVLTLMLTTACASVDDLDLSKVGETGENVVTLTVQTQSQSGGMRDATVLTTPPATTIGKATLIDALIYAVYEKISDNKYQVIEDSKIAKGSDVQGMTAGKGQTIITWNGKPMTLTLTLEAGKEYRVVFWAQNKDTKAYNTNDLAAIKVNYKDEDNKDMFNNDEARDAFCAYVDIKSKNATESVVLRRPLAQINVGTAGWDYEGAAHLHPSPVSYTQSRITLEGVAQYYSALDESNTEKTGYGKTLVDNNGHSTTNVTFELNTLPAFMNLSESDKAKPKIDKYDKGEEFLVVDLDKTDNGFKPYVDWDEYQTWLKDENGGLAKDATHPATEIFKYLSMCYVLVPEAGNYTDLPEGDRPNASVTYGAVLKSVKFEAYGIEPEEAADNGSQDEETTKMVDVDGEEDEDDGEDNAPSDTDKGYGLGEVFKITNVPVQKNWRTNILGYNLFVFSHNYILDIVPDYCGDYNQIDGNIDDDKNWSGDTDGKENPKFDDDDRKYYEDPYTGSDPKDDDEEEHEEE